MSRFDVMSRAAPGSSRRRAKRTADHTAPPSTTSAPRPLPTPASARGNASRWSLPTGIAVPSMVPWIGVVNITPAAKPVNTSSAARTARPARRPHSRYTVPRASHGTFTIAPSRKKARNVPVSQPVAVPVASAALASANSARANVHAPW
jgi:hypothetical protein